MSKATLDEQNRTGGRLLTVLNTQSRLAVGRTKVFELVSNGDLEAVKLGARTTRIVEASVDAYIERLRGATQPA